MIQDMAIPQDDGATQVKAIQQQTLNAITNTQNLIEKKQPVNTQLVVKFDVQQLSRYSFQIITCQEGLFTNSKKEESKNEAQLLVVDTPKTNDNDVMDLLNDFDEPAPQKPAAGGFGFIDQQQPAPKQQKQEGFGFISQ